MNNDRSGLDASTSWPDVQLSLISVTPGVDGGLVYRRYVLIIVDGECSRWFTYMTDDILAYNSMYKL